MNFRRQEKEEKGVPPGGRGRISCAAVKGKEGKPSVSQGEIAEGPISGPPTFL